MNVTDYFTKPVGKLDIIVFDSITGEIIRKDEGDNIVLNWSKEILAYLFSGRGFSNKGNHGEDLPDDMSIEHFHNNKTYETDQSHLIKESSWKYKKEFEGMVLNEDSSVLSDGDSIYPIFPTKMKFGIGKHTDEDINGAKITNLKTPKNKDNKNFPFIVLDKTENFFKFTVDEDKTIIQFSIKMPAGDDSYIYNNIELSEAGLYCDKSKIITGESSSNKEMITGTMLCYRNFKNIYKSKDIEITFNWSLKF